MPGLRGLGPDLAASDVITLSHPMVMPDGYYGEETVTIGESTIAALSLLPDGTQISSVEQELTAEDRERLEDATERYLFWEQGVTAKERHPCMDAGLDTVEVEGSLLHVSSMQDCDPDSPLRALNTLAEDVLGERVAQLARPYQEWAVEIRPWAGDGPDESAPVESYALSGEAFADGMWIIAENAPEGWGTSLDDGVVPGRLLAPWVLSGPVLSTLDELLLAQDELGCPDPVSEIRVIHQLPHRDPELSMAFPLCAEQPTADLAAQLRSL